MAVFYLKENETVSATLGSPPAVGISYSISYREILGTKRIQRVEEPKNVGGLISSGSQTLLTCPAGKTLEVVAYTFVNGEGSSVDLTLTAGLGQVFRYLSLPSGDIVTPTGVFSSSGVLRTSGSSGTNATMSLTSGTSNSVGTGAKTFGYSATPNIGISVGTRVRAASVGAPSNFIEGTVTAVSATSLTINADATGGAGSYNDWAIGLIGTPGTPGADGSDGADGTNGTNGVNADMTRTSSSSNSIGTGSKVFAYSLSNNLGWTVGQRIRAAYDGSNYLEGEISTVSGTSVTIDADNTLGSGVYTSWHLGVAGDVGEAGLNGVNGADGADGADGVNADMTRTSTTSVAIGTGSKTFSYASSANLGWAAGMRLRAWNSAGNYLEGEITSVSATSVTVNADVAVGSGTYTSWSLGLGGTQRVVTDFRTGVAMTANGTTTVNTTLNGDYTDHDIVFNQLTGGTTENNLVDITNASAGKYYIFTVTRDGTAGTKTINFSGSGRTYNRSWISGTQAIGVNERWIFIVRAVSATVFDVIARRTA